MATYTYTLTSNPGNLFKISGNSILVNVSNISAGNYPVTVRADDGAGSIIDQNLVLVAASVIPPPSPALIFNVAANSQYVGTLIGGL